MKPLRVLFIVSELAPLTGESPRAKEHRYLSRALAETGIEVTIALPGDRVPESARGGLARRLTPYVLAADTSGGTSTPKRELTVFEGSAGDGRVAVLVLDDASHEDVAPDAQAAPSAQAAFCRAAVRIAEQRGSYPDLVFAAHGTEGALAELDKLPCLDADAEQPIPASVFLLRDLEAPGVDVALSHAALSDTALGDTHRLVAPSAAWVDAALKRSDRGHQDLTSRRLVDVRDKIFGVPSGIDSIEWNPHQDGLLDRDFPRDPRAGKAAHKARLREQLSLRQSNQNIPLIAIIGPMDENILTYGTVNELARTEIQLVVIADRVGDATSVRHVERSANQTPHHIAIRTFGDPEERRVFEHHVLAAADFCLFPHDFSLDSLCELHCMHYGTIPIAPRTGSFADLLVEFDSLSHTGSGFLFEPYDGDHLLNAVHRALRAYTREDSFAELIERAMSMDLSWRTTAQRYINIMVDVLRKRSRADELAS